MIKIKFAKKSFLNAIVLFFIVGFLFSDAAVAASTVSTNVSTTKSLFSWMQKNLNHNSNFTLQEIEHFFAPNFEIDSNNKIIHATPSTYRHFLYQYKNNLASVHYDVQQYINANENIIVPFIIDIKSINGKKDQKLRVIAIFSFNKSGKITRWREVFTQYVNEKV